MVSKTLSLREKTVDNGPLKTRTGSRSRPNESWKSERFPTNTDHVAIIHGWVCGHGMIERVMVFDHHGQPQLVVAAECFFAR